MSAADKVMSRQRQMKRIHVNNEINEIFDMTGLIDLLVIEQPDEEGKYDNPLGYLYFRMDHKNC